MDGFIDIHTHILPESDDGARTVSETRNMIRMAWKDGTRAMFLTPHYGGNYKDNQASWLREKFDIVQQLMKGECPEMKLYLGTELRYEKDAKEDLLAGRILTMNDSRYVLLEFDNITMRNEVINAVMEMTYCGYSPVIAHVERYSIFHKDASLIDEVLNLGALLQVNAESIMGTHGLRIKRYCHKLLRDGNVHFVASDSHHVDNRPPLLSQCWKKVKKKYGEKYAELLFCENARAIIENREL